MSYTSKDIKNIVAEILENKKDKGREFFKARKKCNVYRNSLSGIRLKTLFA